MQYVRAAVTLISGLLPFPFCSFICDSGQSVPHYSCRSFE
jgi:hypothetical protein